MLSTACYSFMIASHGLMLSVHLVITSSLSQWHSCSKIDVGPIYYHRDHGLLTNLVAGPRRIVIRD